MKISCSLDIQGSQELLLFPFLHFSSLKIAPAKHFSRLSLALIRENLTHIFKATRHVEQNRENKFSVTSSMYLYSNTSWPKSNHSAQSVHIIV